MIEFVNKEDAQGPSIMEMARAIKEICVATEYIECPVCCGLFDEDKGCLLSGNDPSDWDIGEMP